MNCDLIKDKLYQASNWLPSTLFRLEDQIDELDEIKELVEPFVASKIDYIISRLDYLQQEDHKSVNKALDCLSEAIDLIDNF